MMLNHCRLSLFLAILFLGALGWHPSPAGAQAPVKSTWLWQTPLIKTSATEILNFSTSNGVNTIYLQVNRDVHSSYYKNFIKAAKARGIEVHALDGKPRWAFESEQPKIAAFLSWVKTYQAGAAQDEKFSGIHLDIEPYSLYEWKTNQAAMIPQWQNNMRYIVQEAADMGLPVGGDIPFWLCSYKVPDGSETLSRWMMRQYDSVTIMAYRDTAEKIAGIASKELDEAADAGIPAVIAVETLSISERAFITFYEEGTAYMNQQLTKLNSQLQTHPAFAGIAVHDYAGWKALKP